MTTTFTTTETTGSQDGRRHNRQFFSPPALTQKTMRSWGRAGETRPYCFSITHTPGQKQKAPDANSRKPTDDAKNSLCNVISRSRTPSLVLKRVSAFLRPPRRGNQTYQLIWKKNLPLLRPPVSATFAPLHGPRSKNTPYAMQIYKISKKRSKTVSKASPHGWILPRVYENSSNSKMNSAQWME